MTLRAGLFRVSYSTSVPFYTQRIHLCQSYPKSNALPAPSVARHSEKRSQR
jgi:hypothetical protein